MELCLLSRFGNRDAYPMLAAGTICESLLPVIIDGQY